MPGADPMKRKVLLGSLAWLVMITLVHLQLNVGWSSLSRQLSVMVGEEREELVVGFLPVT